jgi:hypothetical protein
MADHMPLATARQILTSALSSSPTNPAKHEQTSGSPGKPHLRNMDCVISVGRLHDPRAHRQAAWDGWNRFLVDLINSAHALQVQLLRRRS